MPRRVVANGAELARAAGSRPAVEVLPPEGERPVYYSNNTQVRMTLNDAVFDLGIVESTTGERIVVRQTARVIMAIPHVKRLAELLNRQLAEYEEQHGPIPSAEPRRRASAASRAGEA